MITYLYFNSIKVQLELTLILLLLKFPDFNSIKVQLELVELI